MSHSREVILSHFAYQIGGWNATPGVKSGRLVFESFYENDEQIVKHILQSYREDIERPLKNEIQELKALLYDKNNK